MLGKVEFLGESYGFILAWEKRWFDEVNLWIIITSVRQRGNHWITYWEHDRLFPEEIWKKNVEVFVRGVQPILNFSSFDRVLDIGCGPGYLAQLIHSRVKKIYCIDTAKEYVVECRRRLGCYRNVTVRRLSVNNYTNLRFLPQKFFTKIVCLSVLQYYESIDQVVSLVENVRRVAKPGALFLIADLHTGIHPVVDTGAFLVACRQEKFFIGGLGFLVRARLSEYCRLTKEKGLLTISEVEWRAIFRRLSISAKLLSLPLTLNAARKHVLIQF